MSFVAILFKVKLLLQFKKTTVKANTLVKLQMFNFLKVELVINIFEYYFRLVFFDGKRKKLNNKY